MDLDRWYKQQRAKFKPGGDCADYSLKIEIEYGGDRGTCHGYTIAFGTAYMAYLTSYQTAFVDVYRDFYEMGHITHWSHMTQNS